MKTTIKFTLFFLLPFFAAAQNLSNAKTYKNAIELAQQQQKPVLLIIKASPSTAIPTNVAPNAAIQDAEVVNKMKANFIVFDTERTDPAISQTIATYHINTFPTFLFMHPNGDAFHNDFGYSPTKTKYLMMLDKAIALSKEKSISALAKAYETNKTDTTLLKQLISLRKKNGIIDNSELIEAYVSQLKPADFDQYQTVLFVMEAGPQLDGNAYKLSLSNNKIYSKIYQSEPLAKRMAINNAIINNNFEAAVKAKNVAKALRLASFIGGTWANDRQKGEKASTGRMLAYYHAVKDTASYFSSAIGFYDRHYMQLSTDSIKKIDQEMKAAAAERMNRQLASNSSLNGISKEKMDSLLLANKVVKRTELVAVNSSFSDQYASELNNAAFVFYQTGTKNIDHLSKAMSWSKRAIMLSPMWANYDTLAHLYYAMGNYNEALATQQIAIDLVKKIPNHTGILRSTTETYEKMKQQIL